MEIVVAIAKAVQLVAVEAEVAVRAQFHHVWVLVLIHARERATAAPEHAQVIVAIIVLDRVILLVHAVKEHV